MAVICGADGFVQIEDFGWAKRGLAQAESGSLALVAHIAERHGGQLLVRPVLCLELPVEG